MIRAYRAEDKADLMDLLKTNIPDFFAASEVKDLEYYLDNELEQYFVYEVNGRLVGAGGINYDEEGLEGIISWDFIHSDYHGQGFGSQLLGYRLQLLFSNEAIEKVIVRTSQFVYAYYAKFGFELLRTEHDYWAKGYHLYHMELDRNQYMKRIDYSKLDHLKWGNSRQFRAYELIQSLDLWKILSPYDPLLAGTVPIEIDIDGSDLDILCRVTEFDSFVELLKTHFGSYDNFLVDRGFTLGLEYVAVSFKTQDFPIEIFAQNVPSKEQHAYRHMLIEASILSDRGAEFKAEVLELKRKGLKTEPAFAQVLGLSGDPYLGLLDLE